MVVKELSGPKADASPMELVCPAGNPAALEAALENGADAVYVGLRDETNARAFPGLNFDAKMLRQAVQEAHRAGRRLFLAINSYAQAGEEVRWHRAVAVGAEAGVDVLILADIGVMEWATRHFPEVTRHLSVQASATSVEALKLYHEAFDIQRAVLPRVLSLAQVKALAEASPIELEVFGFGSLCVMVEGRCALSAHVTGQSPNTHGVCSPAWAVEWRDCGPELEARLNGVLIDRFGPGEAAGYPTVCKGRYEVMNAVYHAFEEPTSLNTLELLPELMSMGVSAVKIEGRQRSPAYIARVTATWRAAVDAVKRGSGLTRRIEWQNTLASLAEGSQTTLGAYHRPWQ